jgi:hypothetical protein
MVFSAVVLAAIANVKTWKGTRKETRRKARKKTKKAIIALFFCQNCVRDFNKIYFRVPN